MDIDQLRLIAPDLCGDCEKTKFPDCSKSWLAVNQNRANVDLSSKTKPGKNNEPTNQ